MSARRRPRSGSCQVVIGGTRRPCRSGRPCRHLELAVVGLARESWGRHEARRRELGTPDAAVRTLLRPCGGVRDEHRAATSHALVRDADSALHRLSQVSGLNGLPPTDRPSCKRGPATCTRHFTHIHSSRSRPHSGPSVVAHTTGFTRQSWPHSAAPAGAPVETKVALGGRTSSFAPFTASAPCGERKPLQPHGDKLLPPAPRGRRSTVAEHVPG